MQSMFYLLGIRLVLQIMKILYIFYKYIVSNNLGLPFSTLLKIAFQKGVYTNRATFFTCLKRACRWGDHAVQNGFNHSFVFRKCFILVRLELEFLISVNFSLLYKCANTQKKVFFVKNPPFTLQCMKMHCCL